MTDACLCCLRPVPTVVVRIYMPQTDEVPFETRTLDLCLRCRMLVVRA